MVYLTTEEELRQAMATAFFHCRPGGVAIFAPDHVRETFAPWTEHGGHAGPAGRSAQPGRRPSVAPGLPFQARAHARLGPDAHGGGPVPTEMGMPTTMFVAVSNTITQLPAKCVT